MRTSFFGVFAGLAAVATAYIEPPPEVPRGIEEFRQKHPYKNKHNTGHNGRKVVTMKASCNDADDIADEFEAALHEANKGGTLYIPSGDTIMIGHPLNLTWLDDVQVHLDGEIKFTNDTEYWQSVAYTHPFQDSIMFWMWGGKDIKIYGEGTLNGNGQRWWNEFSGKEILDDDNDYLRPILFYAQNASGLAIEGIHFKDSPCWTNFIVTSEDVSFTDVVCTAESNNATVLPKNTDFFDSLNIVNLTVERTWVNIGDDCFSPKSNGTNMHVNYMYCNGTHGQSMGSLGQYSGEKSFVQDVVIENVWLLNGQHGARIKTWAGEDVGYGFVDNITFRNFWQSANEYSAYLDSCYFNIDEETCAAYPSGMNITNIHFENFSGYTSGKYGRAVAKLTCSSSEDAVCENITFTNFNITSPCGEAVVLCDGISGDIGIDCVSVDSEEGIAALADTCSVATAPIDYNPW
ncbi:putative exopolygalacturonase B [Zalerion maritima]|uniref:galacturonan 1,4-alpha-galacturonidase n=1 Tax=Zalerion maritima TaxID=339359 RepID=A0AAD5WRB1_9PEZI|nr:putative exopolygalacturonase B [Zalerion maritima]